MNEVRRGGSAASKTGPVVRDSPTPVPVRDVTPSRKSGTVPAVANRSSKPYGVLSPANKVALVGADQAELERRKRSLAKITEVTRRLAQKGAQRDVGAREGAIIYGTEPIATGPTRRDPEDPHVVPHRQQSPVRRKAAASPGGASPSYPRDGVFIRQGSKQRLMSPSSKRQFPGRANVTTDANKVMPPKRQCKATGASQPTDTFSPNEPVWDATTGKSTSGSGTPRQPTSRRHSPTLRTTMNDPTPPRPRGVGKGIGPPKEHDIFLRTPQPSPNPTPRRASSADRMRSTLNILDHSYTPRARDMPGYSGVHSRAGLGKSHTYALGNNNVLGLGITEPPGRLAPHAHPVVRCKGRSASADARLASCNPNDLLDGRSAAEAGPTRHETLAKQKSERAAALRSSKPTVFTPPPQDNKVRTVSPTMKTSRDNTVAYPSRPVVSVTNGNGSGDAAVSSKSHVLRRDAKSNLADILAPRPTNIRSNSAGQMSDGHVSRRAVRPETKSQIGSLLQWN